MKMRDVRKLGQQAVIFRARAPSVWPAEAPAAVALCPDLTQETQEIKYAHHDTRAHQRPATCASEAQPRRGRSRAQSKSAWRPLAEAVLDGQDWTETGPRLNRD